MSRSLIQLGIGDLEALFAKSKTDVKVLKQLELELQYRQVPRAVALLAEVQAAMYGANPTAPTATPPKPSPAPPPQQSGLWERPVSPATGLVATPIASAIPTEPVKATAPPVVPKTPQATQPAMSVEDAYKLLEAAVGSTWESLEQTRRQLVQRSHPARLKSMSPERRAQTLADAKRVNAAYMTLSWARCGGR